MGNATKAGVILELGDIELTLSPLRLIDLEALELYLQGRAIAVGKESLPESLSEEEREAAELEIVTKAERLNIFDKRPNPKFPDDRKKDIAEFDKLCNTAGLTRLLYYAAKQNEPTLTLEKCRQLMNNYEYAIKVMQAIAQISPKGIEEAEESKKLNAAKAG